MSSEHYTHTFYKEIRKGSTRSAEVMVPLVLQLFPVRSVVDVGCGDGSWLSVFRKLGVDDILGIDGDHVTQDLLQVPPEHFQAVDLTKPFALGRGFDLAISLEVAEHLPLASAPEFVASLTRLAPVVLFSAAVPHQGGTNHLNEQWPQYWADLFAQHGFVFCDVIRPRIWTDSNVEWWYVQNVFLAVSKDRLSAHPQLQCGQVMPIVHPRMWEKSNAEWMKARSDLLKACDEPSLRTLVDKLPRAIERAIRSHLSRRVPNRHK